MVGAISVNALKSWATRAYPDLWVLILGGTFVLIVMFMPKGIVGLPSQIQEIIAKIRRKTRETDTSPPAISPETADP